MPRFYSTSSMTAGPTLGSSWSGSVEAAARASRLWRRLVPSAQVVGTDEFWDGTDFRLDRVLADVLRPLASGRATTFESWNWAAQASAGLRTVAPEGVVVVEGVCALHRTLRDFYDVRVWVETARDTRLERAVRRDGEAARSTWLERWFPREERYIREDDPVACADLVISGDGADAAG